MDSFPIEEVRDQFTADMRSAVDAVRDGLAGMVAPIDGVGQGPFASAETAENGCHTMTGSASLVGAVALAGAAGDLGRILAGARGAMLEIQRASARLQALRTASAGVIADLDRLVELELAKDRTGAEALAGDIAGRAAAALLAPTPIPEPDEVAFDFSEGSTPEPEIEATDAFAFTDEVVASLTDAQEPAPRQAGQPKQDLDLNAALLEAFTGEAAELLDDLDRRALELESGSPTALAELLRSYHTLKGTANTVGFDRIGAVAHRIEDLLEASTRELPTQALVSALIEIQRSLRSWLAAGGRPDAATVEAVLALLPQPGSTPAPTEQPHAAAEPTADSSALSDPNDEPLPTVTVERRFLRIAADHLDDLMHLAGELVQGRARLTARTGLLASLQRDLRASRERLSDVITTFRDRYEYSGLDGGSALPGKAVDPLSAHFTDLELDRYEDIHILSRSLGEIGSDIHELQRQISQIIGEVGEDADGFGRIVGGIQGRITRARMVPVGQLFTRLRLTSRDAAGRVGRQVRVEFSGDEVSLDKGIIDGIQAPLLHLVRNAVVHGIEDQDARSAAGKPAEGSITLAARQEAGQVILTVSDDGSGLDLSALHRRGVSMGLIAPETAVESPGVRDLVFAPGLSTTAAADAVSGRGFGCDVARREIQRLGGSLGVSTRPGGGTTFTATLPLTLAITRALLLRQGDLGYAIPMPFVEHILDLDEVGVVRSGGSARIPWQGQMLVLHELAGLLGIPARRTIGGPALILRLGDQRWALRVDTLQAQTEIVVGSLGELLSGHPLFSGATVSGSGELILILDVAGLFAPGHLVRPAPVVVRPLLTTAPAAAVSTRPRQRVLVVDDSVSVRLATAAHLRDLGADVVLAVDGEDALSKLRQGGIDLVLTDLEMPRLHGYDLIREIRLVPAWQRLPVIVVTSRSGDKHRAQAAAVGASGYLTKPFGSEDLARCLRTWGARNST